MSKPEVFTTYRTPDNRVWFEIYPGKLVHAHSQAEALRLKNQGREGSAKDYIRNFHGPLQKL